MIVQGLELAETGSEPTSIRWSEHTDSNTNETESEPVSRYGSCTVSSVQRQGRDTVFSADSEPTSIRWSEHTDSSTNETELNQSLGTAVTQFRACRNKVETLFLARTRTGSEHTVSTTVYYRVPNKKGGGPSTFCRILPPPIVIAPRPLIMLEGAREEGIFSESPPHHQLLITTPP